MGLRNDAPVVLDVITVPRLVAALQAPPSDQKCHNLSRLSPTHTLAMGTDRLAAYDNKHPTISFAVSNFPFVLNQGHGTIKPRRGSRLSALLETQDAQCAKSPLAYALAHGERLEVAVERDENCVIGFRDGGNQCVG